MIVMWYIDLDHVRKDRFENQCCMLETVMNILRVVALTTSDKIPKQKKLPPKKKKWKSIHTNRA
jgi:hypothetical protein